FVGSDLFTIFLLGLTPQALCCRLLRRLKAKVLKHKTPYNLSGASTKSFVKFAAVQETADDDQTTNIDRDRKSRD
ncbi:MAG TPA: hypothetical protein VM656_03155, partial [Pyrinomonadaceae bacterium]|nr:hypothetical protein [Pyrinomonadaceae bacterium]